MKRFALLFLYLLQTAFAKTCRNPPPEAVAWEKKLQKDLRVGYKTAESSSDGSQANVTMNFKMKYFTYDSDNQLLTVQAALIMSWQDCRLQWKPEEYDGVEQTELSTLRIWHPVLILNNTATANEDYFIDFLTRCQIKSGGKVRCAYQNVYQVICVPKLRAWPYDAQTCSLKFRAYSTKTNAADFKIRAPKRAMTMFVAGFGFEWVITGYNQTLDDAKHNLEMALTLEREVPGLAVIVVFPTLILTTITLTSLVLDVRNTVRLVFSCFNLIYHYTFLSNVEAVALKSHDSPSLLLYYRGSFILAVVALFLTLILSIVCKKSTTPNNLVISVNSFVFGKFLKIFVFPLWDCKENGVESDWTRFANIINCVFVFIFVVAYSCMYASLVPQPIPYN